MKREIKFRGLRTDGKVWVYGSLVCIGNLRFIIDYISEDMYIKFRDHKKINHEQVLGRRFIEVIPETVGQFTGLKDCNGTYIYEGDIVHFDDTPYCVSGLKIDGKIVYYKGSWAIEYQATFTKDFHLMRKLFSSEDFIGRKSKIIGNIHEK